jgi:hypothetical protein
MKRAKRFQEGGDVPEGGRFAKGDPDIYKRAQTAVLRQQLDESFPTETPKRRASKPASTQEASADSSKRFPSDMRSRGALRGVRSDADGSVGKPMESDKSKRFPSQGDAELARLRRIDKPLERVEPEAYMPPLRALRAAVGAGGAARAAAAAPRALPAPTKPQPQFLGYGDRKFIKQTVDNRRLTQDELDELRMGGEGGGFRRGGKVAANFAKGGYVRSADGCCQRGKTKGTFR